MQDPNAIDDLTGGQHRDVSGARSNASRWVWLAVFLVLTMGSATLIGAATTPGDWYEALQKPAFTPPDWLFGPVWTLLYACVAIAGWLTWVRAYKSLAMQVWFAQLAVNFMWSPAFFSMQRPGLALAIIAAMIALTVLFIRLVWRPDRLSAMLMLPYCAWICFAAIVNFSIWQMN